MIIDKPLLVAQLINQLAQHLQGIIIGEAPTEGKKAISTLLGGSSFARFCQQEIGEFPALLGQ